MIDAGVLLSLPTESIAIRVVIASLAAALLARLLLRTGLRVPRIRAATALVPALALTGVLLLFWGSLRLPALMMPVEAADALPIPVSNSYLHFAPAAVPLLLGLWATVAGVRLGLRVRALRRSRRAAVDAFRADSMGPVRVRRTVRQLASQLRIQPPPVAVVDDCVGGATVVGVSQPVLMIDSVLATDLDDEELEGVIAHELAHVKRRDNLVAFALGLIRDVAFFVPGVRWAVRQLHAERELAADQLAVHVTGRPAALASGLLRVVDLVEAPAARDVACASLVPHGTVVGRVQLLIDDRPAAGPGRGTLELSALTLAVALAVVAGARIPTALAGAGERDALAVLFPPIGVAAEAVDAPESRAFQVYRDTSRLEASASAAAPAAAIVDDDPTELHPNSLRACAAGGASCDRSPSSPGLGLQPRPLVRTDTAMVDRWRANPVVSTEEGLAVYWLQRLE